MQNRFKSPVFWAAIASQILSVLVLVGVIGTGQSEVFNGVIVAVLEMLTAFGVLNNPTNPTGF